MSDAVVCLLKGGFAEEAFGLTRTLFDIVFTLRYIASKDTDARAERFYFYFTKDAVNLEEISQAHYPNMEPGEDIQRMIERAKIYTKRYSWSGKTASELAFRTRYV